jgi:hypothetical protein
MNEPLDQDALEYGSMMPEQPKAVLCSALVSLPGQPLCRHYTGAALEHLRGDYSCKCLAGVPYELFPSDMLRWPCRRRHILGREQAECSAKDYGSEISGDVDAQVDEMAKRALGQANDQALRSAPTADAERRKDSGT